MKKSILKADKQDARCQAISGDVSNLPPAPAESSLTRIASHFLLPWVAQVRLMMLKDKPTMLIRGLKARPKDRVFADEEIEASISIRGLTQCTK